MSGGAPPGVSPSVTPTTSPLHACLIEPRRVGVAKRISVPARRDRVLLLGATSHALLTLLGAAGEA